MKTQLIIAIYGKDHDGLINQLTLKTKALGGKWLANKLTHLDGFIAGLFKMEIDSDDVDAFKSMTAEFTDVKFSLFEQSEQPSDLRKSFRLTIEGEDRSGLTSDITQLLYDQDVHVVHFQSQRFPVVGLGTGVFEAEIDIELPDSLHFNSLKSQLESLGGQLRVFLTEVKTD